MLRGLSLSALILIPVFWQQRIQSADLASHIYNAWLASQVERGELPGLYFASQTTNIVFDLMLLELLKLVGADWAQRIAVSACVLVFFWGAYAAVRRIAGSFPVYMLPLLAILIYGFVFRLGLFNFYLGMGLALAALSVLWERPSRRWWMAAPLAALCYACHALPFVWLAALAAYRHASVSVRPRQRLWLLAAAAAGICAFAVVALWKFPSEWLKNQALMTTGADQAMLYGDRYRYLVFGWMLLQVSFFVRWTESRGLARARFSIPLHLCLLHALALTAIPSMIWFPGYNTAFSMFAERMGLAQGVLAIALLSGAPSALWQRAGAFALAALFFIWSFQDTARLNELEGAVERMTAALPSKSRALSGLCYEGRFNYAYHLLDRACIGRCYSYGNYEPSTGQFRLRAKPGNGVVLADRVATDALEFGRYRVRTEDEPVYLVDYGSAGATRVPVRTGETASHPCVDDGQHGSRLSFRFQGAAHSAKVAR